MYNRNQLINILEKEDINEFSEYLKLFKHNKDILSQIELEIKMILDGIIILLEIEKNNLSKEIKKRKILERKIDLLASQGLVLSGKLSDLIEFSPLSLGEKEEKTIYLVNEINRIKKIVLETENNIKKITKSENHYKTKIIKCITKFHFLEECLELI